MRLAFRVEGVGAEPDRRLHHSRSCQLADQAGGFKVQAAGAIQILAVRARVGHRPGTHGQRGSMADAVSKRQWQWQQQRHSNVLVSPGRYDPCPTFISWMYILQGHNSPARPAWLTLRPPWRR